MEMEVGENERLETFSCELIVFDLEPRFPPATMDDYFSKPYYDQNATRQSADAQLGASYRGAFIVRPSSQQGQLALSVFDGKVKDF